MLRNFKPLKWRAVNKLSVFFFWLKADGKLPRMRRPEAKERSRAPIFFNLELRKLRNLRRLEFSKEQPSKASAHFCSNAARFLYLAKMLLS